MLPTARLKQCVAARIHTSLALPLKRGDVLVSDGMLLRHWRNGEDTEVVAIRTITAIFEPHDLTVSDDLTRGITLQKLM